MLNIRKSLVVGLLLAAAPAVCQFEPIAAAQQSNTTIKGTVVDENGAPLPGVAILVQGTTVGAATDLDGTFTLSVPSGKKIEISCIGYASQTLAPANGMKVTLQPDTTFLDEVVVVGYGVQNKRDVTTAISSMKADDFKNNSATNFVEMMAARMPGVQVTTLGGQPEGNVAVRVRGLQSVTAGNDPLYVIDGVQGTSANFANLDPNEIESLEVLKDASAAAIYGSKGSCGVILVTTKRGVDSEKPVISYDGQFSVSQASKKPDMLDAYEWAEAYKRSRNGSYLKDNPYGTISDAYSSRTQKYDMVPDVLIPYLNGEEGLTNTDWWDLCMRNAISTKHTVSVGAKTKNYNYFVSANYLYREGIVLNNDFTRYGVRANFDGNRGKLKYGISLSPSYSKNNQVNSDSTYGNEGVIACIMGAYPIMPVYNEDGTYCNTIINQLRAASVDGGKKKNIDTQANFVLNPLQLLNEVTSVNTIAQLLGNAYVSYEFIKGLELKLMAGGDTGFREYNYYRPSTIPDAGSWKKSSSLTTPTATNSRSSNIHYTLSSQLSFNRSFGDHSVNAVAVWEAENYNQSYAQISGIGTEGDDKITTTYGKTVAAGDAYNSFSGYSFLSWLTRAQYSYKGRYMLSASVRGDASSRFGKNNRWGYFPAVSLGWRISDESFLEDASFIDDIKVRASMGQTGNAQIGNYDALALYSSGLVDLGGGLQTYYCSSTSGNLDLGWEKNTQYDFGIDASFYKGLFGINVDGYYSHTTDMLFQVPVPTVTGFETNTVNTGSMQNVGFELNLSSRKAFNNGFSYNFAGNFSLNRNKVLSLGGDDADIIVSPASGAHMITRVGEPVGCFYLMQYGGLFMDQEDLDLYPHEASAMVGDVRFIDANGDGKIEQETDRVICGNYAPDFYYGFSFQLGYKGFDLSASFQGVYGNEILNFARKYTGGQQCNQGGQTYSLEAWPFGDRFDKATRKPTGQCATWISDDWLEDGSYFRLQNLSIGYTLPNKLFKNGSIRNFRVYLQGSNLLTLTNYSGFNPEVNTKSSNPLTPGVDYYGYPLARTYTFGLTFNL